ncbi:MAG TPA: hypothetical protein PKD64_13435, partial [Pirellulaceae bacterium]|nr:hypothetical protein [Pirellulaceae bacterium]
RKGTDAAGWFLSDDKPFSPAYSIRRYSLADKNCCNTRSSILVATSRQAKETIKVERPIKALIKTPTTTNKLERVLL